MIDTLTIEYGQLMNKRVEEFIKSSNRTRCDNADFLDLDIEDIHRNTNLLLKGMDSDLQNELAFINYSFKKTLIDFEKSLGK